MATEPRELDMRAFMRRDWWIIVAAIVVALGAAYLRHPATAASKFTATAYVRVQYPATYTSLPGPDRFVAIVQSPEVTRELATALTLSFDVNTGAHRVPDAAAAATVPQSLSALVAPGDARLVLVRATGSSSALARWMADFAAKSAMRIGSSSIQPQMTELRRAIAATDGSVAQMKADLAKAGKSGGQDSASAITIRTQINQGISMLELQKATALNQLEQLQNGLVADSPTTVAKSSITGGREKSLAQAAVIGLALGLAVALGRELLRRRTAPGA
jgi:hypothetical protein